MRTSRLGAPHPDAPHPAAPPARRAARTPVSTGAAYGRDVVSTLVGGTALLLTMSMFLGLA